MKKTLIAVSVMAMAMIVTGCATTAGSSRTGFAAVNMAREAGEATAEAGSKTGTACSTNIAGIYASGDSSVEAAKKAGGISRVSSVDYEYFTILSFYGKVCTLVKGN